MRPIKSAPSLFTMNGCGFGLYGARDHDHETNTYVATYCVCILFVPVVALTAYRVANAPNGGWYFIGQEYVSGWALRWNRALLTIALLISGWVVWDHYTSTPGYVAGRKMAVADQLLATGDKQGAA